MNATPRKRITTYLRAAARAVLGAAIISGSVLVVSALPAGASSSILASGSHLSPGGSLVSTNGCFTLVMQKDGNAVVYAPGTSAIWASGTNGHAGSVLFMQSDGNLVVIAPGNHPIWASGTSGHPGAGLYMQADGNLVVIAPGNHPVWASNTARSCTNSSTLSQIVTVATAIKNGAAEPGWNGGPVPYSWGGGHASVPGPSIGTCSNYTGSIPCGAPGAPNVTRGVDCTGLTRWVYSIVYGHDVLGSGGSTQINQTHKVASAQPGDIVYFSTTPGGVMTHTGIYIGNDTMIDAAHTGTSVRTDRISTFGEYVLGYYTYGS